MENTDDKRNNEIVQMPTNLEEAEVMLARIQKLQDNFRINSSDGGMSGDIDQGFSYNAG